MAGVQNTATPTVDEQAPQAGAAYVFVRTGTTWSQQAYLKASQVTANDQFGVSVAVSGDTIVVGAPYEDSSTVGVQNGASPTVDEGTMDAGAASLYAPLGLPCQQYLATLHVEQPGLRISAGPHARGVAMPAAE